MLTMTRKREIKNIANSILREHNILQPPVALNTILQEENIKYLETDLSEFGVDNNIDAFIYRDSEINLIAVNIDTHLYNEKKRFSVAHEIGHFYLHIQNQNPYMAARNRNVSENTDEEEANFFAANLLMPDEMVEKSYFSLEIPTLDILSKKFKVSSAAMKFKLDSMGLWYF